MKPRFQFSLRNAFWAMFWASVWGASFSVLQGFDEFWDHEHAHTLYDGLFLPAMVLFVVTPFITVGALFGRPAAGIIVLVYILLVLMLLVPFFVGLM
jgi:hypothetical protein